MVMLQKERGGKIRISKPGEVTVMDFIRRDVRAFAGLVFPRRCIVCTEVLDVDEKFVCGNCAADFPFTWFWAFGDNPAEERLWKRVGIVSAASLYFYRKEGGYAELLHEVKYGGDVKLGHHLGMMLGERMRKSGRFRDIQVIIPVPLHPLRRWRRGYNQAEVIARGIAEGLNQTEPVENLAGPSREEGQPYEGGRRAMKVKVETGVLTRRKYTLTQTRLSGEEKRRNVKDAFAVNLRKAERLKCEGILHILVVDDLLTSGSTLEAAVKPLLPHFLVSTATVGFVE